LVCGGVRPLHPFCWGLLLLVFLVSFVVWRCFAVCFGCVLLLNSYCIATVLLEGGLFGVLVSFCALGFFLGGFLSVFDWCSRLSGGLGSQTGVRFSPGLLSSFIHVTPFSFLSNNP
jgi:hypothetical protein